jgi:hypothetical protein
VSFADAKHYAEQSGLPVIECSFCKPPGSDTSKT